MEINWSIVSWIGIPVIKPIEDAIPLILNPFAQRHQNVLGHAREAHTEEKDFEPSFPKQSYDSAIFGPSAGKLDVNRQAPTLPCIQPIPTILPNL